MVTFTLNPLYACFLPDLLNALMHHLELKQETTIFNGAQLLCNLSWKATDDIKDSLLMCDASVVLIETLQHVKYDQIIRDVTKALWNLSGHSRENRNKISTTRDGSRILPMGVLRTLCIFSRRLTLREIGCCVSSCGSKNCN